MVIYVFASIHGRTGWKTSIPQCFDRQAITTNVYLMLYPKRHSADRLKDRAVLNAVWHSLNEIPPETLVSSGRTYGGGLHKLEPRELMRTPANVEVFGASKARRPSCRFVLHVALYHTQQVEPISRCRIPNA